MSGQDLLNWRRTIDQDSTGSAQPSQGLAALQNMTDMDFKRTQAFKADIAAANQNIAQGLKGIGDAIDHEELMEQGRQKFRLDQQLGQLKVGSEELHQKKISLDMASEQQNMSITDDKWRRDRLVFDKQQRAQDASEEAMVDSYKGPKPANWNKMDPDAKAGYIAGKNDIKDRQLAQQGKQAAINLTYANVGHVNAETAEVGVKTQGAEIDNASKMQNFVAGAGNQNISALSRNPEQAPLFRFDLSNKRDEKIVDQGREDFKKTRDYVDSIRMKNDSVAKIAQAAGLHMDENGHVSDEEIDNFNRSGGVSGFLANHAGTENALIIRSELTKFLSAVAKDKTYGALNFEREVQRAQLSEGGDPSANKVQDIFLDTLTKNGRAKAFFNQQGTAYEQAKTQVKNDFLSSNFFPGVQNTARQQLLYDVLPASKRAEISFDKFMAYTAPQGYGEGQAQANLVFHLDDKTQQPNFLVSPQFSGDLALEKAAKSGALVNIANQGLDYKWGQPGNQELFEAVQKRRGQAAKTLANSPAAQQPLPENHVVTAGHSGEYVDPNSCNPNIMTCFRPDQNAYGAVPDPHGMAAAGATPQGDRGEFKKSVQAKSRLRPAWDTDTLSIFKSVYGTGEGSTAYGAGDGN